MKLNIYLLREDLTEAESAIQPRHRGAKFKPISPKNGLPRGIRGWIQTPTKRAPSWAGWLSEGFELPPNLQNQSNGFLLLVKASGRFFAVAFGYGANALDPATIEPDFGLRIVLNGIEEGQIDTLDTRRLDKVTKQTRTHLNAGQELAEFGIRPTVDWLRSVRGNTSIGSFKGKMQGADSVQVSFKGEIAKLKSVCAELMQLYASKRYKKDYGFLDWLRPLRKKDPRAAALTNKVVDRLKARDEQDLNVAYPEIPERSVHHYEVSLGAVHQSSEEVDLRTVFNFLDLYDTEKSAFPDLHRTLVVALDEQSEACSRQRSLWRYLVAHIELDGSLYVLSLGDWYQVASDYLEKVRQEIREVPDLTNELKLPAWSSGDEGTYNKKVAAARKWLLLDRHMFRFEGDAQSKIECADLVTREGHFVHVKSMSSSATMSHLFAQGTVSARLYRADKKFRQQVSERTKDHFGRAIEEKTVVLAIGSSKSGPIADALFFFSLVNLSFHLREFAAMGAQVALCKIQRPRRKAPTRRAVSTARQRRPGKASLNA